MLLKIKTSTSIEIHHANIFISNSCANIHLIVLGYFFHKKKSCPFSQPKFIRFLIKWEKIDQYATCVVLIFFQFNQKNDLTSLAMIYIFVYYAFVQNTLMRLSRFEPKTLWRHTIIFITKTFQDH